MNRCSHLNDNGEQCRKRARLTLCRFFLDPEVHIGRTEWAVILLCPVHFKPYLHDATPRSSASEKVPPCGICGHSDPHTSPAGEISDACGVPGCSCGYYIPVPSQ